MCFDCDTSVLRSRYTCITDEMHLYHGRKTIVLRPQYANIVDCETASAHTAKPDRRFYFGSDRVKRERNVRYDYSGRSDETGSSVCSKPSAGMVIVVSEGCSMGV